MYNSVIGTDCNSTMKKSGKKDGKSKDPSSTMGSFHESTNHPSKIPLAYQIKPKKLRRRVTGHISAKNKLAHQPIELTKIRKSSTKKSGGIVKSHMKSKSILNGMKFSKISSRYTYDNNFR